MTDDRGTAGGPANIEDWLAVMDIHRRRRPLMEAADMYKLLFQGLLGLEHLLASRQAFVERLQAEWEALPTGPEDPLCEVIHPQGTLLRVNLRPYKAAGLALGDLSAACLATAARRYAQRADLEAAWLGVATHYSAQAPWDGLHDLILRVQADGYPPIHHSPDYCAAYRPAYRVVDRQDVVQFLPVNPVF